MFGFGQWKDYARALESQLTDADRRMTRLRRERDAQRDANEKLRAEIRRLKTPGPKDGPYIQVVGFGSAKEVYLGGHRIENVVSVGHAVRPDSLPETTLVLHGEYVSTEHSKLSTRCPIDFSIHRPDCPLSWRFTAKAEAQYATSRIGDWLDQGWTLEAMLDSGFIEPKP